MRNPLIAALCSALSLGATVAVAAPPEARARAAKPSTQVPEAAEDPPTAGDEQTGELQGQDVEPSTGQNGQVKMGSSPKGGASTTGETHTVVKGDTLWDLSQKYLGSPWYWPKVWSYNPQIANPHWIYPGNRVKFVAEGEDAPSRLEVADAPNGDSDDVVPSSALEDEDTKVHVTGTISYQPKSSINYVQTGFVTARELESTGVISAAFAESLFLTLQDVTYVTFKQRGDVKVGDRYVIYRKIEELHHPITHERVGILTRILGILRVETLPDSKLVRARIIKAYEAIERGDLVGPPGEQFTSAIRERDNDRELKGYVVTPLVPDMTMVGERALIIIDRGSADGVQVGNTFVVIRQADPINEFLNPAQNQDASFPVEDVAQCVALEVKDRASTCMLTRSMREVVAGDRVLMRASTGSGNVKVGVLTR